MSKPDNHIKEIMMSKKLRFRLKGAWEILRGKAYAIPMTPPRYPFVLRINDNIKVHYEKYATNHNQLNKKGK